MEAKFFIIAFLILSLEANAQWFNQSTNTKSPLLNNMADDWYKINT